MPPAYRPATSAWQGACVPDSAGNDPIQQYYDACFGPQKSKVACDAFAALSPSNTRCQGCILTLETASMYGPLIRHGGFVQANVAGCIELTDSTALACAKSMEALSDCEIAACEANCPVSDANSFSAYASCARQADDNGCKLYASTPSCADAGAKSACLAASFEQFYFMAVPLFCGSGPDAAIGLRAEGGADVDRGADVLSLVDSTANSGTDASIPGRAADAAADAGPQ
jgi:hypothetical protein